MSRTGWLAAAMMSVCGTVAAADQAVNAPLELRAANVDTPAPGATLEATIASLPAGGHLVIQLDGPITPQRRAGLEAAGLRLGAYLPTHAYICDPGAADAHAAAALGFIRWWSPYQSAWKLDPDLGKRVYATPERRALTAKGRDRLVIALFASADAGAAAKAIWSVPGAQILAEEQVGDHWEFTVAASLSSTAALAGLPAVQFIEPAPELILRSNLTTRWIVQSNVQNVFPCYANGLHGEGQVIGIIDERIDPNHCSFQDTAHPIGPTHRKLVAYNGPTGAGSHGTHVGGIAAGDAGQETNTRGVAYLARIAYGGGFSGAFSETGFINQSNFQHNAGARIHTNSWGNDGTTAYDGLCRGIDTFTYTNEDDMVCFAVTNLSALKNPENAKNVLAVGNDGDTPNQGTFCTGGAGPTDDGRRKPEIWAPGCDTASSASGTACGTVSFTGTSMASPAIAGVGALVRQYFTEGYYPLGTPGGSPLTPSGALMRATILNSGVDMSGGPGYPGVREGWGRVLIDNALFFPGDARRLLVSDIRNAQGLSTSGQDTVNIAVLGSGQQLRITLVWTEPAATAGASNPVINDLDLEVTDPNNVTYLGNVFDTPSGNSVPGGLHDARNNVEQVHITNPPPGQWSVRIRGTSVAVGTQGYALVATGDIQGGTPPPLVISLPAGAPALVPPNTPTDVAVQILPGAQTVVPGSPSLWYRTSASASFISSPLASLGGDDYRATLPGAACSDTPQFYFSAQGDLGAVVTLPFNAPAGFFAAAVGTVQNTSVLAVDLDGALPAGWNSTGLWHLSGACAPSGTPCAGARWAYYGQDAGCNYDTGVANSGNLTSAPITLPAVPPGGTISLTYCSALQTEDETNYDRAEVLVNTTAVDRAAESAEWESRSVDLTAFAGQTVTLAWRFNSVDAFSNAFRGWQVDNIRITATTVGCTPTCSANCDGSTTPPLLNVNDFVCFQSRFAAADPYADCDQNSALNVNDFICFQAAFAAGCP